MTVGPVLHARRDHPRPCLEMRSVSVMQDFQVTTEGRASHALLVHTNRSRGPATARYVHPGPTRHWSPTPWGAGSVQSPPFLLKPVAQVFTIAHATPALQGKTLSNALNARQGRIRRCQDFIHAKRALPANTAPQLAQIRLQRARAVQTTLSPHEAARASQLVCVPPASPAPVVERACCALQGWSK